MRRTLISTISCASVALTATLLPADDAPAESNESYRDGTLVNERGEPISGARVDVLAFQDGVTDEDGRFRTTVHCYVELENDRLVRGEITSTDPLVVKAHIDAALLQGIWTVVTMQNDGDLEEPMEELRVFIDSKRLTFRENGRVIDDREYGYTLDPSTAPGNIDLSRPDSAILGIYTWDEDRLKLCFNENGPERPIEFDSAAESAADLLLVLEPAPEVMSLDSIPGIDDAENEPIREILTYDHSLQFPGNPLTDVLEYLSTLYNVPFEAEPGVDGDVEIELVAEGANLHTYLLMMLTPHDLQFVLRDGKVVVTPRESD